VQHLPDGSYDVIVVDAEELDEDEIRIELAITLGPRVGEVVALRQRRTASREGPSRGEDSTNFLGMCGTLRVSNGIPVFRPERV